MLAESLLLFTQESAVLRPTEDSTGDTDGKSVIDLS